MRFQLKTQGEKELRYPKKELNETPSCAKTNFISESFFSMVNGMGYKRIDL